MNIKSFQISIEKVSHSIFPLENLWFSWYNIDNRITGRAIRKVKRYGDHN